MADGRQPTPPLLQLFDTYIVFQTSQAVSIVDQHSAHERVLYEDVMRQLSGDGAPAQRLLLPLTLDFAPAELDAIEAHRELLARIGYEIEPFSGRSIVVHTAPNPHPRFEAARCLQELVADLAGGRFGGWQNRLERFAATFACRAAIKAGRFARDAAGWIAETRATRREPIVVGGTGLYIRALAEGLFREPPFDPERREQLRRWSESLEGTDLARWAGRLDPAFLSGGRQRAARAVEVALLTGHALSWWQREARESGTLRPWYIHLTVPREVLHRRLAARVDHMLAAGLVAEVRRHLDAGVAADAVGLDGIGYREVVAMLNGQLAESALRDAILVSTRRYAKRQETWFRNQLRSQSSVVGHQVEPVWLLDASRSPEALASEILGRWKQMTDNR